VADRPRAQLDAVLHGFIQGGHRPAAVVELEITEQGGTLNYHFGVPTLVSVNTNPDKQFKKLPRPAGELVANFGLAGDRHAGRPRRQVSILNAETVRELAERGMPVTPGILGENMTVEGVPVMQLADGVRLRIGEAELEITGDRPACRELLDVHSDALKALVGRTGKMARVVRGGTIRPGDQVEVIDSHPGQHADRA
jgi:MOSC domain-containing protein YiiM